MSDQPHATYTADPALTRAREAVFMSLFGPMAHALNNPMQGALGAVELVGIYPDDAATLRANSVATARSELMRAGELVGALQAYVGGPARPRASWATTFEHCRALSEALASHAGLVIEWPDDELAPNAALTMWLTSSGQALDAMWLGLLEAHRKAKAAGAQVGGLKLQVVASPKGAALRCAHGGAALALEPTLLALVRTQGWSWQVGEGTWSLELTEDLGSDAAGLAC